MMTATPSPLVTVTMVRLPAIMVPFDTLVMFVALAAFPWLGVCEAKLSHRSHDQNERNNFLSHFRFLSL
jgi:hypothetical protein